MPDPLRKTISATQAPALFNVSPYITRWMLYHHFANGLDLDGGADARMNWGKKMQPLIVEQAAAELALEVRPNSDDTYHRRGLLGCTRDATIICPDRGPGALEIKCIFDYATWMRDWGGGKSVPRQNEIQLQQQMFVGDEAGESYRWGQIAAWVAGELHYFERAPIPDLWRRLEQEAAEFWIAVTSKVEPEPFGAPVEIPWLTELLPTVKGNALDLSADPASEPTAQMIADYKYAKGQEGAFAKAAELLRARILALVKDHDEVVLPFGVKVNVSTTKMAAQQRAASIQKRIKVFVPEKLPVEPAASVTTLQAG
jgi:hypothetical protein